MDLDTIKLLALAACAAISLIALLAKKNSLILHGPSAFIFAGLCLITAHYYIVGFSVSEKTNGNIIFAAMLWVATFVSISAYGPEKALESTFRLLSLIVYPATVYLIYQQVSGEAMADNGYFIGIADNPNIMGGYLALLMFPVALQNLLNTSKIQFLTFINIIVTLSILYLIYMTGSRGAALAAGAALAYVALISRSMKPAIKATMIIAIFLCGLLMQQFFLKYEGLGIVNTREYLIILRMEAIAERPWFGWGLAADVNNSFNGTNIFPPQEKGNTFLQFIEEFGVVFGVPFFISIVGICVTISLRLKHNRGKTWVTIFLIAALMHSMIETWMLNFRSFLSIAFWVLLMIGGAYAFGRRAEAMRGPMGGANRRVAVQA